jgi:hypothetical protein
LCGGGETRWLDEVDELAAGRIYRFTWVTEAEVTTDLTGVVLSQNGIQLRLRFDCSVPVAIRVLDSAALIGPNDTPMPAVKRVEFAVTSTGLPIRFGLSATLV